MVTWEGAGELLLRRAGRDVLCLSRRRALERVFSQRLKGTCPKLLAEVLSAPWAFRF